MSKAPIKLKTSDVAKALDDQKNHILGLVDDPKFREFWTMMGGTPEFLDEQKEEVKNWKVK
jgi:hypothetical protein